ncbi:hypothetical protein ACFQ61_08365 [Streptomyces sp. NPDC056500]|uniref:hypothetical protein n=1 Tax=Streptomyces sp. NPDC056500 TaxID=3345840 RepID=UPI0036953D30
MTSIPLALTGTSVSSGTFTPALRLISRIFLAGESTGNGSCLLTASHAAGAFADFALVPYGPNLYPDPALAHVTSAAYRPGGPTDTPGQWRRLALSVVVPNTTYAPGPLGPIYGIYDQARLGVTCLNMALGETQQLAYAQLEQTPPGADLDTDQFGSNLFDLEQASYEGRILYEPVGGSGETDHLSFTRTTERASCGAYSGKLIYQSPPPSNSYTAVKNFGSYPHLLSRRQTYADVRYRPFTAEDALPGTSPTPDAGGTPVAAPPVLTLKPLQRALVRVEPGVTYQAQISAACEAAGEQFQCAILRYDASLNLIGTHAGTAITTTGEYRWQQASAQFLMEDTAVWAAVVPRITSGGAGRVVVYVDEHRIWIPTTLATKKNSASPARPWQPPRQLILKLKATRVNYVANPSFQNSVWGWTQVKDPGITATLTLQTGGGIIGNCARYSIATAPTATLVSGTSPRTGITTMTGQNALISRLTPSTVYTASLYVQPVAGPVPITIWAHTGDTLVRGTSTPLLVAPAPGNAWYRLSVTYKTNDAFGGSGMISVGYGADSIASVYQAVPPDSNAIIWEPLGTDPTGYPAWSQTTAYEAGTRAVYSGQLYEARVKHGPFANVGPLTFGLDHFLHEKADKVGPYFDGNSPSGDYMWEGASGDSRSHYYRGKRVNQYRLDQIIQRQIGVGAAYRIVYASAP